MNRNRKIAVLVDTERSFDRQLLRGIGEYSRRHGPWNFHVVSESIDRLEPPAGLWGAAGVIARLGSNPALIALAETHVPLVAIDGHDTQPPRRQKNSLVRTVVDSNGIARIAAEHFAARGFRRIAFLGTPERDWSELQQCGLEFRAMSISPRHILDPDDGTRRDSRTPRSNPLETWVRRLPKPIAVVACDDMCGFRLLEACRTAGIKVPSEVAVMGVGNDDLLCALASPALSSVALSAVDGGYRVAQTLDCLMNKAPDVPRQLVVQTCGLIVRASTDVDVSQDPHVSAARSIIHGRCSQEVSIAALAKSVGISRRTLELKFRKFAGRTVFDEIQDARLSKAKVILKETELPISRVASSSGYRSVAYFIRVFGKEIGLTPAKYRAASRVSETRQNGHPRASVWKLAE